MSFTQVAAFKVSLPLAWRISRAISVYNATGITLKEWQKKKNKKYFNLKEFIKICLVPPKPKLEERIKKRFEDWKKKTGDSSLDHVSFDGAAKTFRDMITKKDFDDFLTIPLYEKI